MCRKAPGPDGLNAKFYKTAWPWISQDVTTLVQDFYQTGQFPEDLNQTLIILFHKNQQRIIPQGFKLISLCDVIYKIIAKSLADRLKSHLPQCIHLAQVAFHSEQTHISSNIITT